MVWRQNRGSIPPVTEEAKHKGPFNLTQTSPGQHDSTSPPWQTCWLLNWELYYQRHNGALFIVVKRSQAVQNVLKAMNLRLLPAPVWG